MSLSDQRIRREIERLLSQSTPGRTICPSDVARALSDDWRPLMPRVREVAGAMATEGQIRVTQKGREVSATGARGPIRLGRP